MAGAAGERSDWRWSGVAVRCGGGAVVGGKPARRRPFPFVNFAGCTKDGCDGVREAVPAPDGPRRPVPCAAAERHHARAVKCRRPEDGRLPMRAGTTGAPAQPRKHGRLSGWAEPSRSSRAKRFRGTCGSLGDRREAVGRGGGGGRKRWPGAGMSEGWRQCRKDGKGCGDDVMATRATRAAWHRPCRGSPCRLNERERGACGRRRA